MERLAYVEMYKNDHWEISRFHQGFNACAGGVQLRNVTLISRNHTKDTKTSSLSKTKNVPHRWPCRGFLVMSKLFSTAILTYFTLHPNSAEEVKLELCHARYYKQYILNNRM